MQSRINYQEEFEGFQSGDEEAMARKPALDPTPYVLPLSYASLTPEVRSGPPNFLLKLKRRRHSILKSPVLSGLCLESEQSPVVAEQQCHQQGDFTGRSLKKVTDFRARFDDPRLQSMFSCYREEQSKFSSLPISSIGEIASLACQPKWVPKENQIQFSQSFESGNLLRVFQVSDHEFDLYLRCDSNSKGHTNWFYFGLAGLKRGQRVKIRICNILKHNIILSRGLKPFVRKNEGSWQQGADVSQQKFCLFKRVHDKNYYSYSFAFRAPERAVYYFASSPPYTTAALAEQIAQLKVLSKNKVEVRDSQSVGGLPLSLLTFSKSQNPKFVVLVIARQHPGETVGSHMLKGFLRALLDRPKSSVMVKVVPMVNPDGVCLGNFRNSFAGIDLNRTYDCQRKHVFPESEAVCKLAKGLKASFGDRFVMALDFHGHSVRKNVFTFGPPHKDKLAMEVSELFPRLMAESCPYFRYQSCHFNLSTSKRTTARSYLFYRAKVPYVYTIECSFGLWSNGMLNVQQFEDIGKEAANSMFKFLKSISKETLLLPMRERAKSLQPSESDQFSSEGGDSESSGEDLSELEELHQFIETKKRVEQVKRKRLVEHYPLDEEVKTIQFPALKNEPLNKAEFIVKKPQLPCRNETLALREDEPVRRVRFKSDSTKRKAGGLNSRYAKVGQLSLRVRESQQEHSAPSYMPEGVFKIPFDVRPYEQD